MNAILEQVNSTGKIFVEFALPMLVQSGVLILILLLADFALRKKLRAVFRYWIWLLVLLKLLLPTSLSSPLSLGYFFGEGLAYVDIAQATEEPHVTVVGPTPASVPPFIDLTNIEAYRHTPTVPPIIPDTEPAVTEPINSPVVSVTPVTWQGAVFLVWLTVVMAMGLLLLQRAIFVRGLVAQAKEANGFMTDTLESCRRSMGVKRKIGLKVSANATSPAVCGLFRPVILVPQNLTSSLSKSQLRAVLLHELAHIRRGDLWVNLAQTFLQIIYFYNPLLWVANCIIRRVREQAVDEMVLVAMGEAARQYPQTLVNVAKLAFKRPALSLRLIGVVESKSALAGRIKHILNRPMPKRAKLGILGLAVVIITAAILLPMATCTPGPPSLVIKGTVKDAQTGEPIAGARVFDDGYGPKPDWEQIKADVRSEWGAITNSAGEYSFLTWPEHHSIKVQAPGYKAERRSLYSGHFVFNKKDEEIFDFALEPEKILEPSEFKKTLLNGVTVELVGICEHPSEGKQWWKPDGTELSKEIRVRTRGRVSTSGIPYNVAVKVTMPEDATFKWGRIKGETGGISLEAVDSEGRPISNMQALRVYIDEQLTETSIQLGAAAGPWKTRARDSSRGGMSTAGIVFSKAYESDGAVRIIVADEHLDLDYRITAIDTQGKEHVFHQRGGSAGKVRQTTALFHDIKLNQIEYFLFQTRPYQWVTFKNVSLQPGVKTDVQVEVEGAKSEIPQPVKSSIGTARRYFSRVNVRKTRDKELVKTLREDTELFDERVGFLIRDYDDGVLHCIDFDNNRIVRVPDELDINGRDAILKWAKENNVDALFRRASSLMSLNMASTIIVEPEWSELSTRTLEILNKRVPGSTDILYSASGEYHYYAFKTSQGRIGVLGLASLENNGLDHRLLSIKYKLLKPDVQVAGDFHVTRQKFLRLLALPEPQLRHAREAIQLFKERQDWPSLAIAYEVAAETMWRVTHMAPEAFIRPVTEQATDVIELRGRGGPYVMVQTNIDGEWVKGKGEQQNWIDWIQRKQKDLALERIAVLKKLGVLCLDRLNAPPRAVLTYKATGRGVPVCTKPLETLIAQMWPVLKVEANEVLALDQAGAAHIRLEPLQRLAEAQVAAGNLRGAADTRLRAMLTALIGDSGDWNAHGSTQEAEAFWQVVRRLPLDQPLPPTLWLRILDPQHQEITVTAPEDEPHGLPYSFPGPRLVIRPGHTARTLTVAADMETPGGSGGVRCFTIIKGKVHELGWVQWHRDGRQGRGWRQGTFDLPEDVGIIRLEITPFNGTDFHVRNLKVEAAFAASGVLPSGTAMQVEVEEAKATESAEDTENNQKTDVQVEGEKPQSLIFHGLDLTAVPHTTNFSRLPDLFEQRPLGSKSYHIQKDVTAIYSGLDGTVYFIPRRNIFYVQHDKLGSSTLTYYGPFEGNPVQVLNLQPNVQVEDTKIAIGSSGEAVDSSELTGRVVDENGNTVADAQVALSTEKIGVLVSNGKLQPIRSGVESRIVQTDSQGMFDFGQMPVDNFDLIVAHEKGFALVESEEFVASGEIHLQPWGHIDGQLAEGRKAAGNKIWMSLLPNSTWFRHKREYRDETKCDESGHFVFDKVPSGWFEVGYLTRSGKNIWSFTSRTPVVVKPGQTTKMRLGGEGRPVTGKFVPPEGYDKSIYFGEGSRSLLTVRPQEPRPDNYDRMTKQQQRQWREQWHKTDEYKKYRDDYWHHPDWRQYTFFIEKNGSFRIDDVIAGKYKLTVWIEERHTGQGRPEEIAGYYGTIEVPEIPGGRSDEPLDLGELELTMHNPLRVGDIAPLFEAKTLDGKDLKLIDYRGKFVLLSFWQPVFHPEKQQLQELYDTYGGNRQLEIIGLGGNDTLEEVKNYVRENAIPWPQIYTGEEYKSGIAKDYGGFGIFLIDQDGRIIAKDLRGDKLKSVVSEALEVANVNKPDVRVEVERSDKSSESKSSKQTVEKLPEMRGRVYGVVVNSATGEPIAGAYVGVGDFGDSGGSNYSRHRQQGLYAKAQTDEEGRFVLEGVAFRDDHPLVVTHPEFVRHDMKVAVQRGGPEPEIKVSLRPAAKINVTVMDSNGKPLEGFWFIRLEALDGRYFIPPGRDRHLSSFASSIWIELPKPKMKPDKKSLSGTTGFSFTELDSGEYSVDVIKFTIIDNYTPPPAGMVRLLLDTSNITYYGGIANLKIEAGQTNEVAIKPANYQTSITIKMPDDPVKKPHIPPFVVISRNVGLLLWNDGKAHGPEDHRLGRLQKNALYYNMVVDGDVLTIKNLPPGSYSVFAGPIYFMNAVRMKVLSGREVTVEIPVIQLSEHAKVGLWTFDRKVKPEAGSYSVSDLCELISAKTGSNPRIIAEASIQNEKLKLSEREMSVWDLLETLYLEKGWKLKEGAKKTLVLYPAAKADVQVGVEKH